MQDKVSLDNFISRLAHKIAARYPNNCADKADYIQAGHLKLIEINNSNYEKRHFMSYAITSIARAMRETAIDAMCIVSAPRKIKKLAYQIEMLLSLGETEEYIKQELNINNQTFAIAKTLCKTSTWYDFYLELSHEQEPFCVINDLLSSSFLDDEDRSFLYCKLEEDDENFKMTKRQQWTQTKRIRHKLSRSGYGN